MTNLLSFDIYAERIEATGLTVRGAFHVDETDGVPKAVEETGGQTLILIGNAGSVFWPAFRESSEYQDGQSNPLDRWSERIITEIAGALNARALFPFKGPPYYPFQRWAQRAENLSQSPMGTLIHPVYGVWHAYRGALVVDRRLEDLPEKDTVESPCLSCRDQPCLHTCPVNAFQPQGFNSHDCAAHLSGPNQCLDQGCLARNACPAAKPFQYVTEQHRFHLHAFFRAQNRSD